MKNKVISITEARKEIFKIAEDVQKPNTIYTFTVEGSPQAVLMSKEEYDSIMTTMELLSEEDFVKDMRESREEYKRGEYITLDELLKELNWQDKKILNREMMIADSNENKYNAKISKNEKNAGKKVCGKNKQKRKKRNS